MCGNFENHLKIQSVDKSFKCDSFGLNYETFCIVFKQRGKMILPVNYVKELCFWVIEFLNSLYQNPMAGNGLDKFCVF